MTGGEHEMDEQQGTATAVDPAELPGLTRATTS